MRNRQRGFSLIELLIVVAIAIPNLLRSKMAANDSSAVGSLRTINTAEVTYATAYPNFGYSANIPSLGGASPCLVASTATACLIDDTVATATAAGTAKSGYFFTYALNGAGGGINTAYTLLASPANPGTTGQRFFFTDETGVIRYGINSAADTTSSPIQ